MFVLNCYSEIYICIKYNFFSSFFLISFQYALLRCYVVRGTACYRHRYHSQSSLWIYIQYIYIENKRITEIQIWNVCWVWFETANEYTEPEMWKEKKKKTESKLYNHYYIHWDGSAYLDSPTVFSNLNSTVCSVFSLFIRLFSSLMDSLHFKIPNLLFFCILFVVVCWYFWEQPNQIFPCAVLCFFMPFFIEYKMILNLKSIVASILDDICKFWLKNYHIFCLHRDVKKVIESHSASISHTICMDFVFKFYFRAFEVHECLYCNLFWTLFYLFSC